MKAVMTMLLLVVMSLKAQVAVEFYGCFGETQVYIFDESTVRSVTVAEDTVYSNPDAQPIKMPGWDMTEVVEDTSGNNEEVPDWVEAIVLVLFSMFLGFLIGKHTI